MASLPIQVDALEKTYHQGWLRRRNVKALQGVTFHVEPGEIFGLLGPNGAGKTTFIKILLGIARASGGEAKLLGHRAGDRRGRRRVGYLPEHLRIPAHHNAFTALEFYGKLSGVSMSEIRRRRGALLETVGLASRAKDAVKQYSKGMLQRLGLAQALLHDPELLILDEPTDGLDPVGRAEVRRILRELTKKGATIFLNSHLLQEVEMICDRVAILDRGNLRYVGPAQGITAPVANEVQLELQLEGDERHIRTALGEFSADVFDRDSAGNFVLHTRLANQADVDGLVDRLRAEGVSILGLARKKVSLEDAFLQILLDGSDKTQPAMT